MLLYEDNTIFAKLEEVYDSKTMDEVYDYWKKSDELHRLQQMGYNVRLVSREASIDEPNIPLTKDLL